jgi:transcriptional regulator with XRE-family HTH domain
MDITNELILIKEDVNLLTKQIKILIDEVEEIKRQVNKQPSKNKQKLNQMYDNENLKLFEERITEIRERKEKTLDSLGKEIGLTEKYLSALLHGERKIKPLYARRIIETLIKWGAITSKEEVEELVDIIGCAKFSEEELEGLTVKHKSLSATKKDLLIKDLQRTDDALEVIKVANQNLVEMFICDLSIPLSVRLTAFIAYLKLDFRNEKFFEKILKVPDTAIRLEFVRTLRDKAKTLDPIIVNYLMLKDLCTDKALDVRRIAARFACDLIKLDKIPLEFLLELKNDPSGEVKNPCITQITLSSHEDKLSLIYEFRDIHYHVPQSTIRDFIRSYYLTNEVEIPQHEKCVEILLGFIKHDLSSDLSKARAQALLDAIQEPDKELRQKKLEELYK